MRGSLSITAVAALGLALAACGTSDIAHMPVKGGEFETGLRDGYVKLADAEYDETDISDGNAFAERAKMAAMGKPTAPEELNARELSKNHMADLSSARTRLMTALAAGAAAKAPSDAAMAQVSFDCWMQEAEENLQPKHIAACRKGYDASMARVDQAIAPKTVSMRAPAPPPPPAPSAPQTRSFVVYFGLGSDKVPASSAAILNEAAAFAKAKKSGGIYVTGHTDRAGSFKYNMDLAKKRAASVTKALTEMGIKKGAVGSLAQGEVSPAVETRDGVKEPRNRRVEISIVY